MYNLKNCDIGNIRLNTEITKNNDVILCFFYWITQVMKYDAA